MLLDRGLDRDRVGNRKPSELTHLAWDPGARNGNPPIRCASVRVSLVPGPLDTAPGRYRNDELSLENRPTAREGGNDLVAGWIKDPAVEPQAPADPEHCVDDPGVVP